MLTHCGAQLNLPREVLIELDGFKQVRTFGRGDWLIKEGTPVDHLMILCEGTAMLTFSSFLGNIATLGFSECGEVLGLSSAVAGTRTKYRPRHSRTPVWPQYLDQIF
jgi:CRP-like cAMP-binding protein